MNKEILYPHFKYFIVMSKKRWIGWEAHKNDKEPTIIFLGSTKECDLYFNIDLGYIYRVDGLSVMENANHLYPDYNYYSMELDNIKKQMKGDSVFANCIWAEAAKEAEKFLCLK